MKHGGAPRAWVSCFIRWSKVEREAGATLRARVVVWSGGTWRADELFLLFLCLDLVQDGYSSCSPGGRGVLLWQRGGVLLGDGGVLLDYQGHELVGV